MTNTGNACLPYYLSGRDEAIPVIESHCVKDSRSSEMKCLVDSRILNLLTQILTPQAWMLDHFSEQPWRKCKENHRYKAYYL